MKTLNEVFDRIVLINLDHRTDRLEAFDKQAKALGIEYIRFPAITPDMLNSNPTDACKQSHISVLHNAVKDGVGNLLVFEDDATFVDNFLEEFNQVYSQLPEDWDMFYLGAWHLRFEEYNQKLVKMVKSYSAHAYGIRAKYLQQALSEALGPYPLDMALAQRHQFIQAYCAKPALVFQSPGYSDIIKEYRDVTDKYL
jgi:GR25 family glycosyltransferase involved in LPS biosynthesis